MTYDFTDLVLLIGMNPLPNYVAAKYFLENNQKLERIWMICSEETQEKNQKSTKEYAEVLKKLLEKNKLVFPEMIFVSDIGSKQAIESALKKIVENTNEKRVHLSFTGGTKAMSVYTYSYLKEKISDFSASYLSARSFKIKFDDGGITKNLKDCVKISFDNLLQLHLFEQKGESENDYKDFGKVVNKFRQLIKEETISEFYSNNGYKRDIFKIKDKDREKIFKNIKNTHSTMLKVVQDNVFLQTELKKLKEKEKSNFENRVNILRKIMEYKPNRTFLDIINSFPEKYRIYNDNKFNTNITEEDYKKAVECMDGFWFEQYVGKLIKEEFKNEFDEILFNQEPYRQSEENKFELDIVLMRGYQLIGISLTTAKEKHICKSKGFEIILRTRQIGGGEAKAILITRANKETVQKLQSELILNTGTSQKNILVLGIDDWKKDEFIKKTGDFISE